LRQPALLTAIAAPGERRGPSGAWDFPPGLPPCCSLDLPSPGPCTPPRSQVVAVQVAGQPLSIDAQVEVHKGPRLRRRLSPGAPLRRHSAWRQQAGGVPHAVRVTGERAGQRAVRQGSAATA
jgi:hypothetical protein